MGKPDKVLVAVDFSPMSKHALRAALVMARRSPLEVHLLHVIPEYEVHSAFHISLPERGEVESKANKWAEKAFETYLRGEDLGGTALVKAVRYGNPARMVCGYADEIGAMVILIASHGRSGFERAMFGSVAEKVLRTCRQPVMVVKGEH